MSTTSSASTSIVAVTGLAFEARIAAGPGVTALAGGGDGQRLTADIEHEIARGATALMSFGVAGGLADAVAPGTWVIADMVVSASTRWPADAAWSAALARLLPGALRGAVAGADVVVATSAAKRALRATSGACAVDMESHIVAAVATAHAMPFAVFRVIADPVARALAPAAAKGMRADGTIDQLAVLGALLRAPAQLPALMHNARDAQSARHALSRGRRLLGRSLGYPDL